MARTYRFIRSRPRRSARRTGKRLIGRVHAPAANAGSRGVGGFFDEAGDVRANSCIVAKARRDRVERISCATVRRNRSAAHLSWHRLPGRHRGAGRYMSDRYSLSTGLAMSCMCRSKFPPCRTFSRSAKKNFKVCATVGNAMSSHGMSCSENSRTSRLSTPAEKSRSSSVAR